MCGIYRRAKVREFTARFFRWLRNAASADPSQIDDTVLLNDLLVNFGVPEKPAGREHVLGLIAEALWYEITAELGDGRCLPVHLEGHDWSVTDPGGDGLAIFKRSNGFYFVLWESKGHGSAKSAVRETVNRASSQVNVNALDYLGRFKSVWQYIDDEDLARFIAGISDEWVNATDSAYVGVSVSASGKADSNACFAGMVGYFQLQSGHHRGRLHLMVDVKVLSRRTRKFIWRGCGLCKKPSD
jgi:hypothetical protein